jgi:hypothetical protein
MTLLIPEKRERVASPLLERERIKVRVLVKRAIFFARGSRFCLRDLHRNGILSRALNEARCKRTLTLILSLSGRGDTAVAI